MAEEVNKELVMDVVMEGVVDKEVTKVVEKVNKELVIEATEVVEAVEVIEVTEVIRPGKSLLRTSMSSRFLNLAYFDVLKKKKLG